MPRTRSGDSGAATEPTPQDAIKDLLGGLFARARAAGKNETEAGRACAKAETDITLSLPA